VAGSSNNSRPATAHQASKRHQQGRFTPLFLATQQYLNFIKNKAKLTYNVVNKRNSLAQKLASYAAHRFVTLFL
jgi:hypothetical protein